MGIPLKFCATVTVTLCSVSFGGGASAQYQAGASANFGKWWVRSKPSKTASQNFAAKEGPESTVAVRSVTPPLSANTDADESTASISRFGFNFNEHKTDHYQVLLRHQGVPGEVIDETGKLLERAYHEFFSNLKEAGFKLEPVTERLPWLVFDDQDQYHDFARVSDGMSSTSLESYYAARTNQVVLMQASGTSSWRYDKSYDRDLPTASRAISGMDQPAPVSEVSGGGGLLDVRRAVHEAAHQLAFNTGLQKRGVMYPLWVSEGLATNFECDSASAIGMGGENAPRQRQLIRAHAGGRLMDLQSFVTMVNITGGGPSSANDLYAQSWALFNFLFKTRRSDLKNYLANLAQVEPGTRDEETMHQEFTSAFGSIDRLQHSWNKYLNSLR